MNETVKEAATFMDLAKEFALKVQELAIEHGPEAWELALLVARVDAISEIALPGIFAVMFLFSGICFSFPFRKGFKILKEGGRNADNWLLVGGFGVAGSVMFLGLALLELVNVWAWAGIIAPELWIAKSVLGL